MKGWQIFVHSLRLVFGNFADAVRVSGLLFAALAAATLLVGRDIVAFGGMQEMMDAGQFPWLQGMLFVAVLLVTSIWTAVAWHRFILKEERPGSILPAWHGDRILAYFGASMLLALVSVLVSLVIGFVAVPLTMIFAFGSMTVAVLIGLALTIPLVIVLYRLTPILPAAAVGASWSLGEAWRATSGASGAMLVLAIATIGATTILDQIGLRAFAESLILSILWQGSTYWLSLMVGVSIATTLYGHYVEKRPLT